MKENSKSFPLFSVIYKYASLAKVSLRSILYYPGKAIIEFFVTFCRVCILLILYSYAYKYLGKSINNIDFQVACWSIGIYFILLSVNARRIFNEINDDIVSGKIETLVNKPMGYLIYKVSWQLGSNVLNAIIAFFGGLAFLITIIGIPAFAFNTIWIIEVILLTVLGLALAYAVYIIIALTAFWLNNARPVFWICDKAVMILGGSFLPVALFPTVIQMIAQYSPFGAIMFSTYVFNPNFASEAPRLIIIQIAWILIACLSVKFIYKAAEKKLTVNGG